MSTTPLAGWDRLRHGGLLLDPPRLQLINRLQPGPLSNWHQHELRRQATSLLAGNSEPSAFIAFVLERICGFNQTTGVWWRGSAVGTEWSRRTPTGESIRPRQLWRGPHGSTPPRVPRQRKQLGIGRGRRTASQVVQWLRAGNERLALLTNGRQWRLIFAGLDFDAWCEWDTELVVRRRTAVCAGQRPPHTHQPTRLDHHRQHAELTPARQPYSTVAKARQNSPPLWANASAKPSNCWCRLTAKSSRNTAATSTQLKSTEPPCAWSCALS
ncbi:MAG UNVERIFIED_CONTAM: hypothetical protein LVR18_15025 [Planctomycetaceae bacterium]